MIPLLLWDFIFLFFSIFILCVYVSVLPACVPEEFRERASDPLKLESLMVVRDHESAEN